MGIWAKAAYLALAAAGAAIGPAAAASQLSPATAGALRGACNMRLGADFFAAGGGPAHWLYCDAKGELKLKDKIYQVFEYRTNGYGEVTLSVMEPGFAPEPKNYQHVLYVDLAGTAADSCGSFACLADFDAFTIAVTQRPGEVKTVLAKQNLRGKCTASAANNQVNQANKLLASCEGPDWRLHISAAGAAAGPAAAISLTGACNSRLNAAAIRRGGGGNIWLDCDAHGELKLNGKIYNVFEYKTFGFGTAELSVIEQSHDSSADIDAFQYVRNVKLAGTGGNMPADGLWNSRNFTVAMTGGMDKDLNDLPPVKRDLSGQCAYPFNARGERPGNMLESCDGADWSLHISAGAAKGR